MSDKLVTTITGKLTEESKCRYIDKEYYLVGDINIENSGDCYLINGRYVRYNSGHIEYDNETKQYVRVNETPLMRGIVRFDDSTKEPIFGYFSENRMRNITIYLKSKEYFTCISEELMKNNLVYREEMSTGIYYHISLKKAHTLNRLAQIDRKFKESLPYDSRGITDQYIENYDKNYNPIISPNIERYSKVLKNLTFGLEFETVEGLIPKNKLSLLPLIPLRDGSIAGLEYVTIPLSGKKGLQAVVDSVKELDKRTSYNDSCALHLHLGGLPRTKENILSFYKLCSHLQDEMFAMFPLYKKYNFGIKRKNYSKPFPTNLLNAKLDSAINSKNIDENFNVLYQYLSVGQSFFDVKCDLKNVKSHPSDPQGTAKWNINTRYYAINFIPILFGNKQTVEFRIHTPTYDIDKIICFLFISAILVNFSIKHSNDILSNKEFLPPLNLSNIIRLFCVMNYFHYSGLALSLT